jgi:hypothetical protein
MEGITPRPTGWYLAGAGEFDNARDLVDDLYKAYPNKPRGRGFAKGGEVWRRSQTFNRAYHTSRGPNKEKGADLPVCNAQESRCCTK